MCFFLTRAVVVNKLKMYSKSEFEKAVRDAGGKLPFSFIPDLFDFRHLAMEGIPDYTIFALYEKYVLPVPPCGGRDYLLLGLWQKYTGVRVSAYSSPLVLAAAESSRGEALLAEASHISLNGVDVPRDLYAIIFSFLGHDRIGLYSVAMVDNVWRTAYLSTWEILHVRSRTILMDLHPFVLHNAHTLHIHWMIGNQDALTCVVPKMGNLRHVQFDSAADISHNYRTMGECLVALSREQEQELESIEIRKSIKVSELARYPRLRSLHAMVVIEDGGSFPISLTELCIFQGYGRKDWSAHVTTTPLEVHGVQCLELIHPMHVATLRVLHVGRWDYTKDVFPELTELSLYRWTPIDFAKCTPKLKTLRIGTNNLTTTLWDRLRWPLAHCDRIVVEGPLYASSVDMRLRTGITFIHINFIHVLIVSMEVLDRLCELRMSIRTFPNEDIREQWLRFKFKNTLSRRLYSYWGEGRRVMMGRLFPT